MTQVHDFEHGPFQVVCIATPSGAAHGLPNGLPNGLPTGSPNDGPARWSSAAMLMRLDSRGFDDRPRWFAHDLPTASAALAHAASRARAMIDAGDVDAGEIDSTSIDAGTMPAPGTADGPTRRATAVPS